METSERRAESRRADSRSRPRGCCIIHGSVHTQCSGTWQLTDWTSSAPGPWSRYASGSGCLGAMLNESSPDRNGTCLAPSTWELLRHDNPSPCVRDLLPPSTILYVAPRRHCQWPRGARALVEQFSFSYGEGSFESS